MKTNQDYKNAALAALKGNWAPAVVATIVFMAIECMVLGPSNYHSIVNPYAVLPVFYSGPLFLLLILVSAPMGVGYYNAFKVLYERGDDRITYNIFVIGFTKWLHIVWVILVMKIYVLLWSLLFLIPGIIKSFSYAMTPYIIVEHPELTANEAIDMSRKLMSGHKFDLFYLYLSFIGWAILSIITFGIGFLWLTPYCMTSVASFYDDIKGPADIDMQTGTVNPEPSSDNPASDDNNGTKTVDEQ
ncbi:MAG: DUF975 family protein [Bacteroidales bacterium]|jgi:uncharacterized membrane protein|nr:DUF975 family protein [Bacteroidales bacterium]